MSQSHPDWALGFQDETWWSRTVQPDRYGWSDPDHPMRLEAHRLPKGDPDPKALACFGLLLKDYRKDQTQMLLRFVQGQPASQGTLDFLAWCCEQIEAQGKKALLMVWDNASWHTSRMVQTWLQEHNRSVKVTGKGVRIISCLLPTKSPWLNPIEPHWLHAKRNIAESDRPLGYAEIPERVYAYFACPAQEPLPISKKSP